MGRGLYEKLGRMGEYVQVKSFEILKESKVSFKKYKRRRSRTQCQWQLLPLVAHDAAPAPESPLCSVPFHSSFSLTFALLPSWPRLGPSTSLC